MISVKARMIKRKGMLCLFCVKGLYYAEGIVSLLRKNGLQKLRKCGVLGMKSLSRKFVKVFICFVLVLIIILNNKKKKIFEQFFISIINYYFIKFIELLKNFKLN